MSDRGEQPRPDASGAPEPYGNVGQVDPHADPVTEPALRPVGEEQTVDMRVDRRPDRTRLSGLYVGLLLGALVLVFLLVFVLQNGASVDITFLWMTGRLPIGVALLLAAVAGVLLVAIPGTGRIVQLRRAARRARPTPHRKI